MAAFIHTLRVRYNECDQQNIVFNANYFLYFDIAITELLREAFGNYTDMFDAGADLVVAEATARYRAPAHFDDVIDIEVGVKHLGTTSLVTRMLVKRDDQLLVEGELRHVFVAARTHEKTPIPADIRAGLERYLIAGEAEAAA